MDEQAIAILGGTGDQGLGLALRFAAAGRPVVIGSRQLERAVEAADGVRKRVDGGRVEGVENAEEIYSLPGVDAIFVGPNDLKFQMRDASGNDPTPDAFDAAMRHVLETGKKVGTPVGLHVQTTQDVQRRIEEGWRFIALASELKMMLSGAQQFVSDLNLKTGTADLARY